MDKKVYEKTRYQNIYRHKINKNYIIMMSKPVKTSIASIDGKKIMKLEDALKIRDNPKIKVQKGLEIAYKEDFDSIWYKYITANKNELKLAYNTVIRKEKMYNKYLKGYFSKKVSKITKDEIIIFLNKMDTSDKQKNEMIRLLKAFFNWCIKEEYLIISPMININKFKTEKPQMKYWTPDEIKKILNVLEEDIKSSNYLLIKKARLIKIFILINFSLGDRIGETRALTFDCFNENLGIVNIKHSINYDRSSSDFLSNTKNYHSQRDVDISNKLINEVNDYKNFLIDYTNYDIKDSDMIFFNYQTNKPYSDTTLRKNFNYYCKK